MQDIFSTEGRDVLIQRIHALTADTNPLWGKMNAAQMLAHCNMLPFGMVHDNTFPKPNALVRLVMKLFIKPIAAGNKPYKKNSQTGPPFKVTTEKNFAEEQQKLIAYIHKTHALGVDYFLRRASPFGMLTKAEWVNLFYKHLNHHLTQFGV